MATQKKTVLITGCSAGGIGAGLAEIFLKKGYHVFPTVRDLAKLPPTLATAPNATPMKLDVLSSDSIAAAVSDVTKHTDGRLDVLINNSGQNLVRPALDTSLGEGRKLFALNFWAPLAMIQAFAPLLIEAQGCVVNQSSAAGHISMPFLSQCPKLLPRMPDVMRPANMIYCPTTGVYCASKAALTMASETWRHELEPLGVRTMTLVTTAVKTPAFGRIDKPEIPKTSYYYVIRKYIEQLADGRLQEGAPGPEAYALQVYKEVERGTTGQVWVGKDAAMNRWSLRLLPQSVFVSFTSTVCFQLTADI